MSLSNWQHEQLVHPDGFKTSIPVIELSDAHFHIPMYLSKLFHHYYHHHSLSKVLLQTTFPCKAAFYFNTFLVTFQKNETQSIHYLGGKVGNNQVA